MAPGIRPATERDVPALHAALTALSDELGDTHRADAEALARALFDARPVASALLAEEAEGLAGVVLFSPVFSTVQGGCGIHVSDIRVDAARRGRGIGAALLRAAAAAGHAGWGASFLRLAVHDDNPQAQGFYAGLGFDGTAGERILLLAGQDFDRVRRGA